MSAYISCRRSSIIDCKSISVVLEIRWRDPTHLPFTLATLGELVLSYEVRRGMRSSQAARSGWDWPRLRLAAPMQLLVASHRR